MDVRAFCRQSRVLIVAGKGGVGKTTMVAALAHMAAERRALGPGGRARGATGVAIGLRRTTTRSATPVRCSGRPARRRGRRRPDDAGRSPPGPCRPGLITPDDALLEYLADHGLRRVSRRLMATGIVDLVAGAIPGIRDILVLGKVKQIERSRMADLVLVDAPATGHTMTFLSSAGGLLDAARGGPIRTQAADVVELLSDPARCQVALVTLPEEMPVNEAVEAAYQLEDKVGIALGPVIVNACYPADRRSRRAGPAGRARRPGSTLDAELLSSLESARRFRTRRQELQEERAAPSRRTSSRCPSCGCRSSSPTRSARRARRPERGPGGGDRRAARCRLPAATR